MSETSYSELLGTHKQILAELKEITKDHESRIRIVERVVYGILAVVGAVEIMAKLPFLKIG